MARLKEAGQLTFCDPVADLKRGWWESLTPAQAKAVLEAILARHEQEAQPAQSLAADLDPFEDENDGW